MKRREDPRDAPQAPADVGELEPRHLRRRPGRTAHPEDPRAGEVVEVVPRAARERTVLPVSGERAHDEPRVLLAQDAVAETEAFEHPRAELLEEHVVALDELEERRAPALLLQVQAGAPLVAVEREEHRRSVAPHRGHHTKVVPALGVLDLVDAGAEIGEHQRGKRPRQQSAQIEDANPGERETVLHAGQAPRHGALT